MSNAMPVPEEILERILELVYLHLPAKTNILLVCRAFQRIALPFLYSSLVLKSRDQADKLAATLSKRPALAQCVRSLRVDSPALGRAFSVLVHAMNTRYRPLDVLDIKLDCSRDETVDHDAFNHFCTALRRCPDARTVIIRKSGYLTHDKTVRAVVDLAYGLRMCSSVERVDLKYKPSPLPSSLLSTLCSPPPHSYLSDPLASSLASLPRLKSLRAQLPAIWNPFLLEVASNQVLDRIELVDRDRDEPSGELESIGPVPVPASAPACTGMSFVTPCEGRVPCRGRGRGMSDVVYAFPSSSSSPSIPQRPHDHDHHTTRPSPSSTYTHTHCPCTTTLNITPVPEIEPSPESCSDVIQLPPSLFMAQASKHPRLHALILAGRRHLFLARMQARAAHVRAEMAAASSASCSGSCSCSWSGSGGVCVCVCAGVRPMSTSLSQTQTNPLPPSPTSPGFGIGSRTRAHTVVPSPSASHSSPASRRIGRP